MYWLVMKGRDDTMDNDSGTVWDLVDGWSPGEAAWFWGLLAPNARVYDVGEQRVLPMPARVLDELAVAVTRRQFGRLLLDAGRERVRRLLVLASERGDTR